MRLRTIFVIFVLIALIGIGGWYFLYSKIVALATEASIAGAKQQSALAAAQQDQSLAAFLTTSSSTATTLLAGIVSADGAVPFIGMIENLGTTANVGLKVQGVSLGSAATLAPGAPASSFDALTLSLSLQGSWNALHVFLSMLETLPYKVQVNNISFSQSVFSAPQPNGKVGKPQSFWSGSLSLSVLKVVSPADSAK